MIVLPAAAGHGWAMLSGTATESSPARQGDRLAGSSAATPLSRAGSGAV